MIKPRKSGNIRTREVSEPLARENYKPDWIPVRPGSQDHEQVPSRQGHRRVWRDGRVEEAV